MPEKPIAYCAYCGEPIYEEDGHYEFPGGYYVCEECVSAFVESHYYVAGGVSTI